MNSAISTHVIIINKQCNIYSCNTHEINSTISTHGVIIKQTEQYLLV